MGNTAVTFMQKNSSDRQPFVQPESPREISFDHLLKDMKKLKKEISDNTSTYKNL